MDLHCEMILEEYREQLPVFEQMKTEVLHVLREALDRSGLVVTAIEARIKTEESLRGKLALKGAKYATLSDITDILGARIITFYTDDVDRIAAMAEQLFEIDWDNSVDKRRLHQLDSFGYNSLHYICRLPGYDFGSNSSCVPRSSMPGPLSTTIPVTRPAWRFRGSTCGVSTVWQASWRWQTMSSVVSVRRSPITGGVYNNWCRTAS